MKQERRTDRKKTKEIKRSYALTTKKDRQRK